MSDATETRHESDDEHEKPLDMQVTVERLSDVERKLAVAVAWTDVKSRLDEAYHELQMGVAIKGFRKGKVPRRMLEQLFGKHVTREVAQRMVQDSIGKALTKEGLSALSEPKVVDEGIKDDEPFKYTATVEVLPEIEPKDYFGIELKQREPNVTDQDVEAALRNKQREMTDFRSVEGRTTQQGDVLLVDLMGKIGDQAYSKENELVELGPEPQEPIPGLAAKLTGIKPDLKELDVELEVAVHKHAEGEPCPADEPKQKARLLVTISDIKQKVVPELDDDFARDTGEADSLAALKEVMRRKLLEQDGKRAAEEAKQELIKEITKRNDVPVVPALVERQLDQSAKLQLAMLGMDPEQHRGALEPLKERMRPEAVEAVKGGLLLAAIGKKEKVEVDEGDVEKRLAEIAVARSQNVSRVRSEYEKEGRLEALRARIREDKTLDLLMSKANITMDKSSTGSSGEQPAEPTP
jgi:trigger factor